MKKTKVLHWVATVMVACDCSGRASELTEPVVSRDTLFAEENGQVAVEWCCFG